MKKNILLTVFLMVGFFFGVALAADVVPTDIEQPGTQPNEVRNLEAPDKCDNCHGGYDNAVEPAFNWRGSLMANAGRDPIFWATVAIAEQDFDGSGDLCIRCHSTGGWYGGRSEPTDGSGLAAGDSDGVDCDTCHSMTNPDNSDENLQGEQFAPYLAYDDNEGYYGSGMLSLFGNGDKLGPYGDAESKHRFQKSKFHRSVDFCGCCHDVSNPVVGNLAPIWGTQPTADPVIADGNLGGAVDGKAAFNNPPYRYGIVERTFSEYKASDLPTTLVSDFNSLPSDLKIQDGALNVAYQAALAAGTGGNYADNDLRFFSCQTCHMKPVTGYGANKRGIPLRQDLPHHDMTGGNYWIGDLIVYQNTNDQLRLGGDMSAIQIAATEAGMVRAEKVLTQAAGLSVDGSTLKVTNLTGHKLISGYPEGRRMWLNIKWYDENGNLLRNSGEYGPIGVMVTNPKDGTEVEVRSILDLHDHNTKIYEAHYGITQEWAAKLIAVNPAYADMVVSYDRDSGVGDGESADEYTLQQVADQDPGTNHESFHFVLNDTVVTDNRIPPYGMNYEEARKRNVLPVPAEQYGYSGVEDDYNYFDEIELEPPPDASYATIDLLYQGTSWEYVQFLVKANKGDNDFLSKEGINLLDAWLNTGMAEPFIMASTTWGTPPVLPQSTVGVNSVQVGSYSGKGNNVTFTATSIFNAGDDVIILAQVMDESDQPISGATVSMMISGPESKELTAISGETGVAELTWQTQAAKRKGGDGTALGDYSATTTAVVAEGYSWNGVPVSVNFTLQ